MVERFDVVIIGAGPGGLSAGLELAKASKRILLLEKNPVVGEPVHCAEGVTRQSFDRFIDVRPHWVRAAPTTGKLISPAGHILTMKHKFGGYILDRTAMEQDLAKEIEREGGEIRLGWRGVKVLGNGKRYDSMEAVDPNGHSVRIDAEVFIAADGVEGVMARDAGIDNRIQLDQTESFLEYRLEGIAVDPTTVEVVLGSQVAPRSYAWVFPVSATAANVGLGVPSNYGAARSVRDYLDRFVDRRFGGGMITRTSCGAAVRFQGMQKLAKLNLLVVGDAARLLDSLTGGGIQLAMASGRVAARAAIGYLEDSSRSLETLHAIYPNSFAEKTETELTRLLRIKQLVDKLSDEELDDLIEALTEYFGDRPAENVSAWQTLAGVIRKKPRILKITRHLFR